jgi:class 3 adenylate cyclase
MHLRQSGLNQRWSEAGLPPFGLGIGVSTGEVAAALLGSDERLEYTVVGDTVNLSQRLQDLARPAGTTVLGETTLAALSEPLDARALPPQRVKGREALVVAYAVVHLPSGKEVLS